MKLQIIHTNDIHSHLENWSILAQFIEDTQAEAREAGIPILTLDIGDAIDSFHPMIEATFGKTMIDLLNQSNYDLVTIGNNEGLNFPKYRLAELYSEANFQVVLGNLKDTDTQKTPTYAKSYHIQDIQGMKFGFLGLTAPYETYNRSGYQILDPIQVIQEQLEILEGLEVDFIILLSHLGINEDRYIAQLFPKINLILGAHTHHVLLEGEWVNQSLICAAGKHGHYIGHLELFFDDTDKEWRYQVNVHTIEQLSRKYRMAIDDTKYIQAGWHILSQKEVADLPYSYYALELHGKHSFIQMALDCLCQYTGYDLAFLSSGLFLQDLAQGIINKKNLHDALPHPIHVSKIHLSGEDLLTLLEDIQYQSEDLRYKLISGNGFRGKIFGEIIFRGIDYDSIKSQWLVLGQPLDFNRDYHIATVDHLHFLPFFPVLEDKGKPEMMLPDFIRHIIRNYLQDKFPIERSEQDE